MKDLKIKTQRLIITQFDESMIETVHLNSLDEDVRKFVPDEVFETLEQARDVVRFLMGRYDGNAGPFVHPVILLSNNENIGYVQAVPLGGDKWEIGYHIAKSQTGNGYATEAVAAFIPVIARDIGISSIWGICRADNTASRRVLEKCGFELQEKAVMDYHGEKREVCRYLFNANTVYG